MQFLRQGNNVDRGIEFLFRSNDIAHMSNTARARTAKAVATITRSTAPAWNRWRMNAGTVEMIGSLRKDVEMSPIPESFLPLPLLFG